MERVYLAMTLVAALGSGVMAGFFFSFSFVVMQSLERLPSPQGIAAMQAINVVVINRWFLGVFFGTAFACAILFVVAAIAARETGSYLLLAASVCYLVGTIMVTIVFNVPRNDAIAAAMPDSAAGAALWSDYLVTWTRWNHVRTASCFAAALLFTLALCERYRVQGF